MKEILRREDGYVSVVFLLVTAAVVPIVLFFMIELHQGYMAKEKAEEIADNLAWGSAWSVQEEQLSQGELTLDTAEVERRIAEMMEAQFKDGPGLFKDRPVIEIAVKEAVSEEPMPVVAGGTNFYSSEPSVVVSVSAPVKGLFLNKDLIVNSVQAVQVVWKETEEEGAVEEIEEAGGVEGEGGEVRNNEVPPTINHMIEKVVNPVAYPIEEPAASEPLRLAAGGLLKYADSGLNTPRLELRNGQMLYEEELVGTGGLPEFVIPYDVPIGTEVVLRWTETDDALGLVERERTIGSITHHLKEGYRVERLNPSE